MATQPTRPWLRLQRPSQSQSQLQPQPPPAPSVPSPVPTTERPPVLRPIFRPITQPTRPPTLNQPNQIPPPSSLPAPSPPKALQVSASLPQISRVPSPPSTPQIRSPIPRVPSPPATLPPISGVASPPASPQIQPTSSPFRDVPSPPRVPAPAPPPPPSPVASLPPPQSPKTAVAPYPIGNFPPPTTAITHTPVVSLPPPPPSPPIVTTPVSLSPKKPSSSPLHNGPAATREVPEVFEGPPLHDHPPRTVDEPVRHEETFLRPPSPLRLPSAKLQTPEPLGPVLDRNILPEAEQKSVLYQKKISGNNAKEHDSRHKKVGSNGDGSVRVITLAGENRGAFMEMIGSKHRGHGQGVHKDSHVIEGRASKEERKKEEGKMMDASPPMRAYSNSNVQGINNSIILGSSCNYHDPGIHLSLSRKPHEGRRSLLHRNKEHHTHGEEHLG